MPAAMSEVGMPVLTAASGVPGDRDEAGLGLDEHVVGLALFQRAAPAESRHVDDDQFGSCGTEFVSAEPQPLGSAWREVLQEDVGTGRSGAATMSAALLALEVDGQAIPCRG